MKTRRIMAMLLCLMTIISIIPGVASAAQSTVTIESQTNSAFDYLQYYADGAWKDLNTPRHWIEQTGEVVYCVEHAASNPHGQTYTATSPSSVFSSSTLSGLNSILMYGYPNNKPSGFTDDEARQATANAIRFWLSEQGEAESYSFTNRRTNPTYIRAKSGYEHVLEYADELLAKARARQELPHGIAFSPSTVQLTASGSNFSGQTSVQLTNINSGYTLNTNALPAGASVSGYTGSRSETLTITVPASAAGQSFSISAQGSDTRSVDNITAYVPASGDYQRIFLCATTAQVVATASFNVGVPAYGQVQVTKTGTNGAALAGVKFGIYSDSGCSNKIAELTTGSDGTATSGNLSVGTVYLKELSTVSPYIITTEVKSASITTNAIARVTFTNSVATGKIRVQKTGDVLTSSQSEKTEYGTVSIPAYAAKGLAGVTYEVKNSADTMIGFTRLQIVCLVILSVIVLFLAIVAFATGTAISHNTAAAAPISSPEIVIIELASPTPSPIPIKMLTPTPGYTLGTVDNAASPLVPSKTKAPTVEFSSEEGECFKLSINSKIVTVAYGVEESTLEKTPGWLTTSAYPGEDGMCVVYGHRNKNHLRILKDVVAGDTITVTLNTGAVYDYSVSKIEVYEHTSDLKLPTMDGRSIALVTCYPFYYSGNAPGKYVVIAQMQANS